MGLQNGVSGRESGENSLNRYGTGDILGTRSTPLTRSSLGFAQGENG